MAFGTGTHETTQLCLEAIGKHYRPGQSLLDVGTGTGILAIAAAKMASGRESILAIDTDADAVEIARTNSELNSVGERIDFAAGVIDPTTEHYDLICANLTADVIVPILSLLIDKADRVLVLSGILAEQEKMVVDLIPADLARSVDRAGEWISVTVMKNR
jgi:ribosomal protein L11 methyltransferase